MNQLIRAIIKKLVDVLPKSSLEAPYILSSPPNDSWRKLIPDFTLIYVCFSIMYFVWYLRDPEVPANVVANYIGWWGWWDQGEYFKTAKDLAKGHITFSSYWYGYPLIGAAFVRLLPAHPFFVPNFLFAFFITYFFYLIAARITSRLEGIVLTFAFILLSQNMILKSLIWPWNCIPIYFAVFAISYYMVFNKTTRFGASLCAILCGVSVLVRPNDTPWLSLFYLSCIYLQEDRATTLRWGLVLAGALLIGVSALLILNFIGYGALIPPYVQAQAGIGFSLENIWFRIYQLFVDGRLIHGNGVLPPGTMTPTFIGQAPLLLLSFGGAIAISRQIGARIYPLFGVCLLAIIYYASFNASSNPPSFWSYHGLRYTWWAMVFLSLLGYYYLRELLRRRRVPKLSHWGNIIVLVLLAIVGFGEHSEVIPAVANESPASSHFRSLFDVKKRTQTINIITEAEKVDGLRISTGGTPYHFTEAGIAENNVILTVNGEKWSYWKDYTAGQDGNAINFHLMRGNPNSRKEIKILLTKVDVPIRLDFIEAITVEFRPFVSLARVIHWVTRGVASFSSNPVAPPLYKIDTTLTFGTVGGGTRYLGSGWSTPETAHIWSTSKDAHLQLQLFEDIGLTGYYLEVEVASFRGGKIEILLDSEVVASRIAVGGGRQRLRSPISIHNTMQPLDVVFRVDKLGVPAEVDRKSDDHRTLGIALFSLKIGKGIE